MALDLTSIIQKHINLDYENRMSKMTKYEKIVFNQCIEQSPELFDTKIKMIELMKTIKSQKITKKSLADQNKILNFTEIIN